MTAQSAVGMRAWAFLALFLVLRLPHLALGQADTSLTVPLIAPKSDISITATSATRQGIGWNGLHVLRYLLLVPSGRGNRTRKGVAAHRSLNMARRYSFSWARSLPVQFGQKRFAAHAIATARSMRTHSSNSFVNYCSALHRHAAGVPVPYSQVSGVSDWNSEMAFEQRGRPFNS